LLDLRREVDEDEAVKEIERGRAEEDKGFEEELRELLDTATTSCCSCSLGERPLHRGRSFERECSGKTALSFSPLPRPSSSDSRDGR
jgi:hypothetical protein